MKFSSATISVTFLKRLSSKQNAALNINITSIAKLLILLGLIAFCACSKYEDRLEEARAALNAKNWEAACRLYGALVDSNPISREVYLSLAKAQFEAKRETEAIRTLSGWLVIDPTDRETHMNLGKLELGRGRRAEAAAHFLTARRYSEYGDDIREAEEWLLRTQTAIQ